MTSATAPVPRTERYFEDYVPGLVEEFGTVAVDAAAIMEFGRRFDPQSFHTDPAAAQAGPYGGLIASGWHTAGLMMRLLVDHYLSAASSLGSPGIDELRWTRPVRPGDTLGVRVTVIEAKRSRSRPDRGLIRTLIEVLNQDRHVVMSLNAMNFLRCRTPG